VSFTDIRLKVDRPKSQSVKRKHGVSPKEAQEIFDRAYLVDQKNDNPEQFRAIDWCSGASADEIAERASRGEDISAYFTNKFTVVSPVRRVNLDLTQGILRELDERAARLNVSRQSVIKTLLGRALAEAPPSKPKPKRKVS
jgi:hypothetical protein